MSRRRWWTVLGALTMLGVACEGRAQPPVRSFAPAKRAPEPEIPREHRPPPGMCRVWLDDVPAGQQPAPTDCATAVRNRPKNGRVIFGDAAADSASRAKEKPRKPGP